MLRPATPQTSGLLLLVVAGVAWGTSGTLGTLLNRASGLGFLPVAGYRILVGGLLLLAAAGFTGRVRLPRHRSGRLRVLAMAACAAVYQFGFFSAVGLLGVSIATLVTVGSAPVLVLVVDLVTGRQRLTRRLGLALVCTAVGLLLFMGTPPDGVTTAAALRGGALALLAGAAFAAISLLGARPERDYDDATGSGLAFLLGGAVVLGVALATGEQVTIDPAPDAVALVVALGLIPSAVAYLAYLRGLRTQSSTTGVMVALLEPLTGAALAFLVLGERLGPTGLAGAVLLLAAVVLASLRPGVPAHAAE
ncbi:DMT family transporter [Tessaracoccus lapidicaptus]|uniref:DMT family transporter n=1 Tax=Tessaracoccus lapidicaptus TaxID=1427523 RepID=UPI0033400CE8